MKFIFPICLFPIFFIACSTLGRIAYPIYPDQAISNFQRGNLIAVDQELRTGSEQDGPSEMLFLLDRGMTLHLLGKYNESNDLFIAAEKKIGKIDKDSNFSPKIYRAEDFEAILIETYISLNYAFLGDNARAIQYARKAEAILERLRLEAKRDYTLPAFFYYWPMLLYERLENWESAAAELARLKAAEFDFPALEKENLLLAVLRKDQSEIKKMYRSRSGEERLGQAFRDIRDNGRIIVLVQNANVAGKKMDQKFPSLPIYVAPAVKFSDAVIFLNGEEVGRTSMLFDISNAARENYRFILEDFHKSLSEKSLRENQMGQEQQQKPEYREYRMGEADSNHSVDLEHWATLPSNLQIFSITAPVGRHHIMLRMQKNNGERAPFRDLGWVDIKRTGEIHILNYRTIDDYKM